MLKNILKKHIFLILVLLLFVYFFGQNLNPFDYQTFIGHDETQAARIIEYKLNLENGIFPPKIAPNMSFGMGYPIFNYYAPTPYLITTFINYLGLDTASSIEVSFFLALIYAFLGMFIFLKKNYDPLISLVGALVFVSSTYFATDIFVRYNLSETWFFASMPLAFWALSAKNSKKNLIFSALFLYISFTTHTLLSLIFIFIAATFAILQKNKEALLIFASGLLLSSHFLIPLVFQLDFVQASNIAKITDYRNHFICISQLWYSPLGFGGSTFGCENDGMSFMIGKILIISGVLGLFFSFINLRPSRIFKNQQFIDNLFFTTLFFMSLFMMTEYSMFIWKTFENQLSIIQFPFRFLTFLVLSLAVFTAIFLKNLPKLLKIIISFVIISGTILMQPKFFIGNTISTKDYADNFATSKYIKDRSATKVAEYLPVSVDYKTWRALEAQKNTQFSYPLLLKKGQAVTILKNTPFEKKFLAKGKGELTLNTHVSPWLEIKINDKQVKSVDTDELGRPLIDIPSQTYDTISIRFIETLIDKVGNTLTLLTGIILFALTPIWHRMKRISKKIH
jgi:hypothetical protein